MRKFLSIIFGGMVLGMAFAECHPADRAFEQFWQNKDGTVLRRLPVQVMPENVFWSFGTQDFMDKMQTFNRMADETFAKGTYNCITLTLRCNPELGDSETMEAAKACIQKAHQNGVKVFMDTDPRIARRAFFKQWPNDRQELVRIVKGNANEQGKVDIAIRFDFVEDHMSWGSKSSYRPVSARVVKAMAVKSASAGNLDWQTARPVAVETLDNASDKSTSDGLQSPVLKVQVKLDNWQNKVDLGHTDFSVAHINGTATGLAANEVLVVVAASSYESIDVFSPHIIPFARDLMVAYKKLGADGGMRDEWGFFPNFADDRTALFWSPHFEAAYKKACGRSLMADMPMLALGARGDALRSQAIRTYMRLILERHAAIERDFYETDKRLFGEDVYVCKHPTWVSSFCSFEIIHHGFDWWQAPRDWAQGDEHAPFFALNGMAKKFGGHVWMNEGYTPTPEQNIFRVWSYAMCGGRQVYHCIYGDESQTKVYNQMPWAEGRVRRHTDLVRPLNVSVQSKVRLTSLITRAPVDSPCAYVFGHERFGDWSDPAHCDWGCGIVTSLAEKGWWCDMFPASEFALGTFKVDNEGWLVVRKHRYPVLIVYNLSDAERSALKQVIANAKVPLRTKLFENDSVQSMAEYLQTCGATLQPVVSANLGWWYPQPDGILSLDDGTVVRVRANHENLAGLPIEEALVSRNVSAKVKALGICAFRAENGQCVALAAGALQAVEVPGLNLKLEQPEDVALMRFADGWHGVWQTHDAQAPLPKALSDLTPHWIRLIK